ncbi:MAG: hypothetical protein J3K34DRAFT_433775 [Monoraphidium minutum]|nr:MAG: hypothetical protein J3K34DRAFT_433775 [Monoraphidium minutum]
MFGSEIDEAAAVEALKELGCEVRYVPDAGGRAAPAQPSGGESYTFAPRLLLEDPAKMARLVQAAIAQGSSGAASPRLLEGTRAAAGGGNLTPRIARDAPGQRSMQAALTISGTGSGPGAATPRFTLSWLGGAADGALAAAGSSPGGDAPRPEREQPRVSDGRQADRGAPSDAARSKGADTAKDGREAVSGSPTKAAGRVSSHVEQGGNLVFSAQAKQAKASKSRLGLSLADAASVFSGGRKGASAAPAPPAQPLLAAGGRDEAARDVGSSRDLVSHK